MFRGLGVVEGSGFRVTGLGVVGKGSGASGRG